MSLESITKDTIKGAAIRELQSLASTVLAGAGAGADIALTGATVRGTTLMSVIMFAAGVPSDVTAEASVTSAGNMQLSTTNSTGNTLLVHYYTKA